MTAPNTAAPVSIATAAEDAAADVMAEFTKSLPSVLPEAPAVTEKSAVVAAPTAETKPAATEGTETVVEGESTEGQDEAPALPEGFIAIPTVTGALATEFTLRDANGEEVDVPNLVVEYKANGKVRRDRYDHVVKLAQMGAYNHERELSLAQREAESRQAAEDAVERLQLREAQLEALLADENEYVDARERYMQANTPEARAVRAQGELARQREQLVAEQRSHQAAAFLDREILPALNTLAEHLPEVSYEELEDKLTLALLPLAKNGYVSPDRYEHVKQYIIHELTPWAKEAHKARSGKKPEVAVPAKPDTTTLDKQREAQKGKNDIGRTVKPSGRSASSEGATQRATTGKHTSIDEAMADVEADVMNSFRRTQT